MTHDLLTERRELNSMTDKTEAVCHWLKRTYETTEHWKAKAVEAFFDANGDSATARYALANVVQAILWWTSQRLRTFQFGMKATQKL